MCCVNKMIKSVEMKAVNVNKIKYTNCCLILQNIWFIQLEPNGIIKLKNNCGHNLTFDDNGYQHDSRMHLLNSQLFE